MRTEIAKQMNSILSELHRIKKKEPKAEVEEDTVEEEENPMEKPKLELWKQTMHMEEDHDLYEL